MVSIYLVQNVQLWTGMQLKTDDRTSELQLFAPNNRPTTGQADMHHWMQEDMAFDIQRLHDARDAFRRLVEKSGRQGMFILRYQCDTTYSLCPRSSIE